MKIYFSKTCFLVVVCSILGNTVSAQVKNFHKTAFIYVVRHAEKDTGNDPRLNVAGFARSGDLYRYFLHQSKMPDRIFVSQYRRSQLSADSLRILAGIDTIHYKADSNGDGLFRRLSGNRQKDKSILIIGHSNTIQVILRRLGIANFPRDNIPDHEYDKIYRVSLKKGKATLTSAKYGSASVFN